MYYATECQQEGSKIKKLLEHSGLYARRLCLKCSVCNDLFSTGCSKTLIYADGGDIGSGPTRFSPQVRIPTRYHHTELAIVGRVAPSRVRVGGRQPWAPSAINMGCMVLTLLILGLLSSKAQRCKDIRKSSKPCHVGIHWTALAEYSQMSTHNGPYTMVSVIFQFIASFCVGQISHQQQKG